MTCLDCRSANGLDKDNESLLQTEASADGPSLHARRGALQFGSGSVSARFLFAGSVSGIVGGCWSTYITFRYTHERSRMLNMNGEPFPSGNVAWPDSISYMAANEQSAAGKVFLCFFVIHGFCTLVSQYPYHFRNVNVGNDVPLIPCCGCLSMNTARAFLPPIGILLVAMDHTVSPNRHTAAINKGLAFHMIGVYAWIGITLLGEVRALLSARVPIGRLERTLRWSLTVCCLLGAVAYVVTQNIRAGPSDICCPNVWRNVTLATVEQAKANLAFDIAAEDLTLMAGLHFNPDAAPPLYRGLYDSASGMALVLVQIGFWGEFVAGACVLLLGLVIWAFSDNRHMATPDPVDEC